MLINLNAALIFDTLKHGKDGNKNRINTSNLCINPCTPVQAFTVFNVSEYWYKYVSV